MTPRKPDLSRLGVDHERLFLPLRQTRPLLLAADAAGAIDCHLVGGALRDTVLGIDFRDLDLVVEWNGLQVARQVASRWPARLVELGGDRFAAYRLVADDETLDIWDRQGASLEADLARRDLTIHSFAVEVSSGDVVDPFQGLADLDNKILRATSETSFSNDPLRVLRLVRFAGQLPGFTTAKATLASAEQSAPDLMRVASERIRSELDLLMNSPDFVSAGELLVKLGLYPGLWLARPGQMESTRETENLRTRLAHLEMLADHSGDRVDRPSARRALLFTYLPTVKKPTCPSDEVAKSLHQGFLSKESAKRTQHLLRWSGFPQNDAAWRWFLHRNGSLWPTAVCYLAATETQPCPLPAYQAHVDRLDRLCLDLGEEIFDPVPLLTGDDLIDELGLPPDRTLGRILSTVRRQQVEGRLTTREEAMALAKRLAADPADLSE